MAMTDHELKDLRAYCAFLLNKYGFHFAPDNPAVPVLYIIHKEMELNNQNNKALASEVEKASSKINPKVFNFNCPGEAWKFQLGIAIKWILSGGLILLFIWVGVWRWSMGKNLEKASRVLGAAEKLHELFERTKMDKRGSHFIDFREAKEDPIQPYLEYQRLNDSTVRVSLGK